MTEKMKQYWDLKYQIPDPIFLMYMSLILSMNAETG